MCPKSSNLEILLPPVNGERGAVKYLLPSAYLQRVPKKMSFSGKTAITTFKLIQNAKVGCFGKFRIFATKWALRFSKLEKKMTEKMKPQVVNPPS